MPCDRRHIKNHRDAALAKLWQLCRRQRHLADRHLDAAYRSRVADLGTHRAPRSGSASLPSRTCFPQSFSDPSAAQSPTVATGCGWFRFRAVACLASRPQPCLRFPPPGAIRRLRCSPLLSLFLGIVTAVNQPARLALVPSLVHAHQLNSAIGINSVIFNLARLIGPAISGIIIASGHTCPGCLRSTPYRLRSFLFILLNLKLATSLQDQPRPEKNSAADLLDGFAYAIRDPRSVVAVAAQYRHRARVRGRWSSCCPASPPPMSSGAAAQTLAFLTATHRRVGADRRRALARRARSRSEI